MKKLHLIYLFTIFASFSGWSQSTGLPGDFLNADKRIPTMPQSPEVAAFEKYGNLPVNLYAGTPNIAIPIYTIQGHEMSLPISLTYDASGIKVDQMASNVGLGWNLNFGGVVSRNVQGQPDGTQVNPSFNTVMSNTTQTHLNGVYSAGFDQIFGSGNGNLRRNIYYDYQNGLIDLQGDTFSFSVNGISGTLIIDYTNSSKVYCVENPDIEVEFINQGAWKITNVDGTTYFFDRAEKTRQEYSGSGQAGLNYNMLYESAWYLTKIISPNGLDIFNFDYSLSVEWTTYDSRKRNHETKVNYYTDCNGNYTTDPAILDYSKHSKKQFYLNSISYNGVTVLTTEMNNTTTHPRYDHAGMRYFDKIKIMNDFTDPLLIVDFDNDTYFTAPGGQQNDQNNSRLKLDGVSFYRDSQAADKKIYSFTYFDPNSIPPRNSNAVDYWGYFNGVGSPGGSLIPDTDDFPMNGITGIDRTTNAYYSKKGTLETITYPTGGKTKFFYEPHLTSTTTASPNGIVGGLRIAKQESTTEDVNGISNTMVKYYYYGDIVADVNNDPLAITTSMAAGPNESSGIPQQDILFTQSKIIKNVVNSCNTEDTSYKFYQHSNNRAVKVPNNITYSSVSEVIFKGGEFQGCTVSKFYNELYDGGQGLPIRPFYNTNLLNGELQEVHTYDANLSLVSTTTNTYENTFLNVPQGFNNENGVYLYVLDGMFGNEPYTLGSACSSPSQNGSFSFYAASWQACGVAGGNHEPSAQNYTVNKYSYYQYHKKLLKTVNKSYEDASVIVDSTTYSYDIANLPLHYFPTEIRTTDSKGMESKTQITYAADLINTSSILDTLLGRNQISEPIEVKNYYNNNLMTTQKKNLSVFGVSNLGNNFERDIIRPSSVEVAKGIDNLETRRIYHSYDAYGNLTEVSGPNGARTYYIWGYHGKQLLVEIKNKPVFGPSGFPTSLQTLIDEAQNISNTETNATTEQNLRDKLNAIRNHVYFENSLVSTFTYDPGIGVTSVTDPKGFVAYYEYDQHNRLKWVKDADLNVIGQNEYSYRVNN